MLSIYKLKHISGHLFLSVNLVTDDCFRARKRSIHVLYCIKNNGTCAANLYDTICRNPQPNLTY